MSKKKSSTKRGEKNPIFNEAMIFGVPAHALQVRFYSFTKKPLRLVVGCIAVAFESPHLDDDHVYTEIYCRQFSYGLPLPTVATLTVRLILLIELT